MEFLAQLLQSRVIKHLLLPRTIQLLAPIFATTPNKSTVKVARDIRHVRNHQFWGSLRATKPKPH